MRQSIYSNALQISVFKIKSWVWTTIIPLNTFIILIDQKGIIVPVWTVGSRGIGYTV